MTDPLLLLLAAMCDRRGGLRGVCSPNPASAKLRGNQMPTKRQSMSYEEICRTRPKKLERLAMKGLLDDATLARIAHLGRFFSRLAELCPEATKVEDTFTEQELQTIWRTTADPDASGLAHRRFLLLKEAEECARGSMTSDVRIDGRF
jgi:hypothetical protein